MSIISPTPARIDEVFVVRSVRHSLGLDQRIVSDVAAALIDGAPTIPAADRRKVAAEIRAELEVSADRAGNAGDWRDAAAALNPRL